MSRDVQRGPGRFGAYALAGAAFGLMFGVAFLALRRSYPDPLRRALVAGVVLAGAVTLSPGLKYPPNPPTVGDPATLAERQWLYVVFIVLSAVVLFGVAYLAGRWREAGWAAHRRLTAVALAVVVPMLTAYALLPPPPDPVMAPATLVWRFRVASLGGNLLLWTVLTVGFGVAAAEAERRMAREHPIPANAGVPAG